MKQIRYQTAAIADLEFSVGPLKEELENTKQKLRSTEEEKQTYSK